MEVSETELYSLLHPMQNLPRRSRANGFGGLPPTQGEELPARPPVGHGHGQRLPGPARPQQQRQFRHLLLHVEGIQVKPLQLHGILSTANNENCNNQMIIRGSCGFKFSLKETTRSPYNLLVTKTVEHLYNIFYCVVKVMSIRELPRIMLLNRIHSRLHILFRSINLGVLFVTQSRAYQ